MFHKNKAGERLYKYISIKLFRPGNKSYQLYTIRAQKKSGFNADGIDTVLKEFTDKIERELPKHEYTMKQIGPVSFNFVHVKELAEGLQIQIQ